MYFLLNFSATLYSKVLLFNIIGFTLSNNKQHIYESLLTYRLIKIQLLVPYKTRCNK